MPFSGNMTRKSSTCSLPAALLTEPSMTPSSSCDGFSPTGSTCSLDKFAPSHSTGRGANSGGRGHHSSSTRHHRHVSSSASQRKERHHSYNEKVASPTPFASSLLGQGGVGLVDPAVVKVFPSPSNKTDVPSSSHTSLPSTRPQQQPPSLPGNTTPLKSCDTTSEHENSDSVSPATPSTHGSSDNRGEKTTPISQSSPTLNGPDWADVVEGSDSSSSLSASRPEWAQMPHANGERDSGMGRTPPSTSSSVLGHPEGLLVNTGMIHMTPDLVGTLQPHSTVHPQHAIPNHAAVQKRNLPSHDERVINNKDKSNIIVPLPFHPPISHNPASGANSNWVVSHQMPSYYQQQQQPSYYQQQHHQHPQHFPSAMAAYTAVRGQAQTHHSHTTHLNHNNSSANGLLQTPAGLPPLSRMQFLGSGGVVPYSNNIRGHTSTACYNCGKRGHLGGSCLGITMDADSNLCE